MTTEIKLHRFFIKHVVNLEAQHTIFITKINELITQLINLYKKLSKAMTDTKISTTSGASGSILGGIALLLAPLCPILAPIGIAGVACGVATVIGSSIARAVIESNKFKHFQKGAEEEFPIILKTYAESYKVNFFEQAIEYKIGCAWLLLNILKSRKESNEYKDSLIQSITIPTKPGREASILAAAEYFINDAIQLLTDPNNADAPNEKKSKLSEILKRLEDPSLDNLINAIFCFGDTVINDSVLDPFKELLSLEPFSNTNIDLSEIISAESHYFTQYPFDLEEIVKVLKLVSIPDTETISYLLHKAIKDAEMLYDTAVKAYKKEKENPKSDTKKVQDLALKVSEAEDAVILCKKEFDKYKYNDALLKSTPQARIDSLQTVTHATMSQEAFSVTKTQISQAAKLGVSQIFHFSGKAATFGFDAAFRIGLRGALCAVPLVFIGLDIWTIVSTWTAPTNKTLTEMDSVLLSLSQLLFDTRAQYKKTMKNLSQIFGPVTPILDPLFQELFHKTGDKDNINYNNYQRLCQLDTISQTAQDTSGSQPSQPSQLGVKVSLPPSSNGNVSPNLPNKTYFIPHSHCTILEDDPFGQRVIQLLQAISSEPLD